MVTSLATMAISYSSYQGDSLVGAGELSEAARNIQLALKIAREIGWRAGESYALWQMAFCLGPQGYYEQALNSALRAVEIATEIGHRQWMTAAQCAIGAVYLDILAPRQALEYLETAHTLAHETGSMIWTRYSTSVLAKAYIDVNRLSDAERVLNAVLEPSSGEMTWWLRQCWAAQAELALARGEPEAALKVVETLVSSTPNLTPGRAIPRLWRLRGLALSMLGRFSESERAFLEAFQEAESQGIRSLLWRVQVALGELYRAQRRHQEAESAFAQARALIHELAQNVPSGSLSSNFLQQAMARLPLTREPTPRQAMKQQFGGLTAREREVAALIAQGMSNRTIAQELVVSERTVDTHVANILAKLGFTSRAQIAAWAVERGLVRGTKGKS